MDFLRFVEILSSANLLLVLLATLVHFGSVALSVIRWRTVLTSFDIHPDFWPLAKISMIGYFSICSSLRGLGEIFFEPTIFRNGKGAGCRPR